MVNTISLITIPEVAVSMVLQNCHLSNYDKKLSANELLNCGLNAFLLST